jgi:hypothetical protein
MKKLFAVLALICLFVLLSPVLSAHAAVGGQAAVHQAEVPSLDDVLATLKNLGGVALLFAAIVNAGKQFGWIKDGQAPQVSLGLNLLAFVGLAVLQILGKGDLVPAVDANAGALAAVINSIIVLIFQLYVSRKVHDEVLAGLPVIGFSFSGRKAGEGPAIEIQDIE